MQRLIASEVTSAAFTVITKHKTAKPKYEFSYYVTTRKHPDIKILSH